MWMHAARLLPGENAAEPYASSLLSRTSRAGPFLAAHHQRIGCHWKPLSVTWLERLRKACLFLPQLPMNIIGRTSEHLFRRTSVFDL